MFNHHKDLLTLSWSLGSYTTASMGRCTRHGKDTGRFAMALGCMFPKKKARVATHAFYISITQQRLTNVFFASDVSKALILTEIGAKRDSATLDVFLGNMKKLLSAPTHG